MTTTAIPSQQSNRDSMAIQDALATLIEAGFTVTATAECLQGVREVRVLLSDTHPPKVRIAEVVNGFHSRFDYETHRVVAGVQVPFDTQSAVDFAVGLLGGGTTWAVTR